MPYKYARGSFLLIINDKDNSAFDLVSIMEARRRRILGRLV